MTIPKKAALYVRVSTVHQIDKDSLPFQRQELINYAKYVLGIDDYEIFEDAGYSAKNTDRPEYQKMMNRIRKNEFSHLLVFKIDRISRNLKDFTAMYEEIKEMKVTFVSKVEQFDTSNAMGEAMLKIILVFAELERKLAAERVYGIMLSRAEKGLWNGATVPFGFVYSEEIEYPVAYEKEVVNVQYIFNLYEKLSSTIEVSNRLNEEGILTKRSGKWTAKTVRDILRNPFYIGTYRYNLRDNEGNLKDESEWIIKEDHHPAIIDKKQFKRVNQLLSDNYRGLVDVRRADIHHHIFSKRIYCANCNALLSAGLDTARKDGYRPSRYTCITSGGAKRCSNYVSDLIMGPFIFNYVSNLMKLQERITPKHSIRDIQRALLRGNAFVDVIGIDGKSLQETRLVLTNSVYSEAYSVTTNNNEPVIVNLEVERLHREQKKFETALGRLEDLYLFGDDGINQKDYIIKKRDIQNRLEEIEKSLSEMISQDVVETSDAFIDNAEYFLITKEMQQTRNVDHRTLSDSAGKEMLSDFIDTIIEKIIVADKRIQSITFKNGITHTFAYKSLLDSQSTAPTKFQYKNYEDAVLEYLRENGPCRRTDIEKEFNMTKHEIYTLLADLIKRQVIGKTGQSVSIRYHIHEKLT